MKLLPAVSSNRKRRKIRKSRSLEKVEISRNKMEHELQQSRKLQQLLQQQEEMCVSVVTEVERKQVGYSINKNK